jgi:hypothetical protein
MPSGGKREGAGRKPDVQKKTPYSIRVKPAAWELFLNLARSSDRTQNQVFTQAVELLRDTYYKDIIWKGMS